MEKDANSQFQQDAQTEEVSAEHIAVMREEMLRFAVLQLRDTTLAEYVVHEAIAAGCFVITNSLSGNIRGRSGPI